MRNAGRHSSAQRRERSGCRGLIRICVLITILAITGFLVQHQQQEAPRSTQTIEITNSALQHIINRHTVGGSENAGKSIFNAGEDIQALIKSAESVPPVASRDKYQRIVEAGRPIGIDRRSGQPTSTYTVITTESGQLVTAFPGRP